MKKEHFNCAASAFHTVTKDLQPSTWKQVEKLTRYTTSPKILHHS